MTVSSRQPPLGWFESETLSLDSDASRSAQALQKAVAVSWGSHTFFIRPALLAFQNCSLASSTDLHGNGSMR